MRIQYIQHVKFEGLGTIRKWAEGHQYELICRRPVHGEPLLDPSEYDMLLIMGGPQSVIELDKYPYLIQEIDHIKESIEAEKPVLGVCLGAQLIGQAFGFRGEKSPHKEVGVFDIQLTENGKMDPLFREMPTEFKVMHWHGDMAGIGKDTEILASSQGCPRQIMRYAPKVYGLQCHLEIEHEGMKRLVEHCSEDLLPGLHIHSEKEIFDHNFEEIHKKMHKILNCFTSL